MISNPTPSIESVVPRKMSLPRYSTIPSVGANPRPGPGLPTLLAKMH